RGGTGGGLERAGCTEGEARCAAGRASASNSCAVLGRQELRDVARARLRRAETQLVVARARVVSGAVVQTDSLQILLEVNRAHVGLLQEEARLTVARLQLGRRVGLSGPVEAVPVDTVPPGELPFTLPQAIQLALEQGPDYRIARGNERAAGATYRSRYATFFPQAALFANVTSFGNRIFPNGLDRSSLTLSV